METSDSDYFESADEDFNSDNEDTTIKAAVPTQKRETSPVIPLENLSITPVNEKQIVETNQVNNNSSANNLGVSTVADASNKSAKRTKQVKSLGVKLGTKVKTDPTFEHEQEMQSRLNKSDDECKFAKDNSNMELKKNDVKSQTLPTNSEVNMWEDDDWEPISNASKLEKCENKAADEATNWTTSWGNWGMSSLLSTATMVTNHVSQGINTVLENGMGVPHPEELARLHKLENKPQRSDASPQENSTFGLGSFVSGVTQITKLVETTGNKVISSGLDTLETIGKKTMEVLQEGDPGLKKKRAFLKIDTDKPVLSHILREAKEKAEEENKLLEENHFSKKANYETLFDDHQGLIHLEALEMLSKQCDIKLQNLLELNSGSDLIEMQETMNQIKELCELTDDDDEKELSTAEIKEKLDTAATEMNVPIAYNRLVLAWEEAEEWLEKVNLNVCNEMELHEQCINILAQLTAIAVEQFHKTGELLLIKQHRSTVDEADSLVQLTVSITTLIGNVARNMSDKLNEKSSCSENKEGVNRLITNVYFEATNSSSYIRDAFQLLIPVLQVGAV